MQRKGIIASVLAAVVLAALTVLATGGPATAAGAVTASRVGPGTQLVTAGRTCAANFVFRDAQGHVYLGYAASCATRTTTATGCAARSLPMGTEVRLAERGRTVGHGTLRYSSLQAMHRAGVTDAATCAANDFALVQVRGAARRLVSAAMPYWGGPSGIAPLPAPGTAVFGLARLSPGARTLPRAGDVTDGDQRVVTVTTLLASTRGARGSGFLDDAGHAVGIVTAASSSGANTVVSLADAVAFAGAHGVAGLTVVDGPGFSGSAIL